MNQESNERQNVSPEEIISDLLTEQRKIDETPDKRRDSLGYLERLAVKIDPRLRLSAASLRIFNRYPQRLNYFVLQAEGGPNELRKLALLRPSVVFDKNGKRASDEEVFQRMISAIKAVRSEDGSDPYLVDNIKEWELIDDAKKVLDKKFGGVSYSGWAPAVTASLLSPQGLREGDFADDANLDLYFSGSDPKAGIWKEKGAIRRVRDSSSELTTFSILEFARLAEADSNQLQNLINEG